MYHHSIEWLRCGIAASFAWLAPRDIADQCIDRLDFGGFALGGRAASRAQQCDGVIHCHSGDGVICRGCGVAAAFRVSRADGVVYSGCDRNGGDRYPRRRHECDVYSVASFAAADGVAHYAGVCA